MFNQTDEEIYSSYGATFYEEMLARICRNAIERKILTREEFLELNDMQVIRKMHLAGVDFSPMYKAPDAWRTTIDDQDGIILSQKMRRVDPPFIDSDGTIRRLSEIDAEFAKYFFECPKYAEYAIKNS